MRPSAEGNKNSWFCNDAVSANAVFEPEDHAILFFEAISPNSDYPSKTGLDVSFAEFPGSRRLTFTESRFGKEERAHPHANGNGDCGNAYPIEHHPLAHLGSDLIVRLTSAVINHKADDGGPEI